MNRFRTLLLVVAGLAAAVSAHAQLSVDLGIKRRNFLRYEPILATVTITNLSGRDLRLEDTATQWFGFQINNGSSENMVAPRDPNYHVDALELKAGESVKRTVDLNTLFALGEFGVYKIKATIFAAPLDKYFASRASGINISEGQVVWQQRVGVPDGYPNAGATHVVSLISFQDTQHRYLYARIEDRDVGTVFCTQQIGPMLDGNEPQIQFDAANNLYVLLATGPKMYTLSKFGVNGDFQGQTNYTSTKSRPQLRRLASGDLQIAGGRREAAQTTASIPKPKLSDRPAGIPSN